jgi:hypothetical protein
MNWGFVYFYENKEAMLLQLFCEGWSCVLSFLANQCNHLNKQKIIEVIKEMPVFPSPLIHFPSAILNETKTNKEILQIFSKCT